MGKAAATVTVLYSSEYGFGDRLSQTLARGITKAGVATEMIDALTVDPQVPLWSPLPCTQVLHLSGHACRCLLIT